MDHTFVKIISLVWFIGIFALILFEKINKSIAALLGASGMIALGVFFGCFRLF
jgi:hypothetical protein